MPEKSLRDILSVEKNVNGDEQIPLGIYYSVEKMATETNNSL
jgi:hypothetical protein